MMMINNNGELTVGGLRRKSLIVWQHRQSRPIVLCDSGEHATSSCAPAPSFSAMTSDSGRYSTHLRQLAMSWLTAQRFGKRYS